jgi:hypothetical protein
MPFDRRASPSGPEALSRFTQIIEEVTGIWLTMYLLVELMRSDEMRTRLAQRFLSFAHSRWTDTQIKQLLLRALRNEMSAPEHMAGVEIRVEGTKRLRGS